MPFKFHSKGRRHIPRQRHRVTNWRDYDTALRNRGSLNGEIGIVRLAARRGSGLRLPTSQRFVGEPNREASTIAKRSVIVTPVRHSMPLRRNVASALGMEFERHDRSSKWQRRSSVPKLLKRPYGPIRAPKSVAAFEKHSPALNAPPAVAPTPTAMPAPRPSGHASSAANLLGRCRY